MLNLETGKIIPDDKVWIYDGIIYIISRKFSKIKGHEEHYSCDRLCLIPEYNDPINLVDIKNRYPNVIKVIHEDWLHGTVYNYGNHKTNDDEEKWEEVGHTKGFA